MTHLYLILSVCLLLSVSISEQKPIIAPGAKLEKLGTGFSFTEGPAADKNGDVYFTDQPNDRIMKWSPGTTNLNGKVEEWMKPSQHCNGMRFDGHGNIIACADEFNQLWLIHPDKTHTVLVRGFGGKLLNGPNDIWPAPNGGIYITDPMYARPYWKRDPAVQQDGQNVFYLSPDHKHLTLAAEGMQTPNGIIGTPDGKTLYVADLGKNETLRFHINEDGTLSDRTFFCGLGSDGMTLDEEGNVYLTGHGVTVLDPSGKQIEHIDVPENWCGNICFAGRDHHLLFITASTSIYGLEMRVRGAHPVK